MTFPFEGSLWVSTEAFTVAVDIAGGVVKKTPPILWAFRGKPASSLVSWCRSLPGFRAKVLSTGGLSERYQEGLRFRAFLA